MERAAGAYAGDTAAIFVMPAYAGIQTSRGDATFKR